MLVYHTFPQVCLFRQLSCLFVNFSPISYGGGTKRGPELGPFLAPFKSAARCTPSYVIGARRASVLNSAVMGCHPCFPLLYRPTRFLPFESLVSWWQQHLLLFPCLL